MAGQQQQAEALEEQLLAALPQEAAAAPAVACLPDRYRKAVTTRLLSAAPVGLHSLLTLVLDAQLSEFAEASPVQLGSQVQTPATCAPHFQRRPGRRVPCCTCFPTGWCSACRT